jgi:branched-chain amino acid aminotransferase
LAYLEGTRQGDDEAILLDGQGFVTEGTVFNVGYFKDGIFVTPPLDIGILDGITRREILAVCRKLKIPTREVRFKKERVFEADEFTMMSTTKGIFPVTRVNGLAIGNGCPGPLTLRVKAAFDEHCEALLK